MTLRERIADWISGGMYNHYKWQSLGLDWFERDLDEANARLDRIAAMETPRCAHIGKRMARVARGEE